MKLIACYDAGAVTRFHTVRTTRQQSVGEHSWGVAMVLCAICEPSAELLKAAMYHDIPELSTGDVPAPAKWGNPELARALNVSEERLTEALGIAVTLSDEETALLKWADMMELVMYAHAEVQMGNRIMAVPMRRGINYLNQLPAPTPAALALLDAFILNQGVSNDLV